MVAAVDTTISIGEWYIPRDRRVAARYERVHGGPAQYLVESVSPEPLPLVTLLRHTGSIGTGRRRYVRNFRVGDEFVAEGVGDDARTEARPVEARLRDPRGVP